MVDSASASPLGEEDKEVSRCADEVAVSEPLGEDFEDEGAANNLEEQDEIPQPAVRQRRRMFHIV